MEKKKRKIFGVIAASAADIEQREILSGIIENAQKHDIDIIVISNIYNPIENSTAIEKENCIYERIASPLFDAFIIIPESVGNPELQKKINDELSKRSRIPTIVLGTPLPEFKLPDFPVINTSDENDLIDITDHLIDICKHQLWMISKQPYSDTKEHKQKMAIPHALTQGIAIINFFSEVLFNFHFLVYYTGICLFQERFQCRKPASCWNGST